MKKPIHTQAAPQAIGPYSQAIQAGDTVYFSGQIPLDPTTMTLVSDDFRAQAQQVFSNIKTVAAAAGGDMTAIVKLTIYVIDLAHFPIVNEVMSEYFSEPYPARTTIQVSALPKNALIEVDTIMVTP
jgi:reactive intermediate/imine deaminase